MSAESSRPRLPRRLPQRQFGPPARYSPILRQKHAATPPWCPLRAFDDGQKTYIQFPPKVAVTEAPPLFVMGRNGDAQLANYRVKGDWYIVDRLFDKAELRLGQAPQTIVAIVRADAKD